MTIPGVTTTTEDERPVRGPNLRLSTVFLTAELTGGAVPPPDLAAQAEKPRALRSLRDLRKFFGQRTAATAQVHDDLEAYWKAKGGRVYITPLRGPAAVAASNEFVDVTPGTAFTATAKSEGSDGNRTSVAVDESGSDFSVTVYRDGVLVEDSGSLATVTDLVAWATATSRWITVTPGTGLDPVATDPVDLTAGADDFAGITNTEIAAALDRFNVDLGPGAVVLPGRTSTAAQLLVSDHCDARNRLARVDGQPVALSSTLIAQAATLRAGDHPDVADMIAPRINFRGLAPGSPGRTISPWVWRCAAETRNDKAGVPPNQPAAGRWGLCPGGLSPTVEWSDEDLSDLNDAGVNIIRVIDGELKLYGARTVADPSTDPAGIRVGSARFRMAIREIARYHAEQDEFAEIDQGGVVLGNLKGVIKRQVSAYASSLYYLSVTAELVEDEDVPGTYLVEVEVVVQISPDAERIHAVIVRQVTQV